MRANSVGKCLAYTNVVSLVFGWIQMKPIVALSQRSHAEALLVGGYRDPDQHVLERLGSASQTPRV